MVFMKKNPSADLEGSMNKRLEQQTGRAQERSEGVKRKTTRGKQGKKKERKKETNMSQKKLGIKKTGSRTLNKRKTFKNLQG